MAPLLFVVYFSLAGSVLGILTGLAPGVHTNTLALLLVSAYGVVEAPLAGVLAFLQAEASLLPVLFSAMIVSAAVVHSFVDFVPSVFLGAPDESEVLSVLPGHRLLLAGKGTEAVRCAAFGSLAGALIGVVLTTPMRFFMGPPLDLYARIETFIPHILLTVLAILIIAEGPDGSVSAAIDCRGGGVRRSGAPIVLRPPDPRSGRPVRISGRVIRRGLRRQIETAFGTWRLIVRGACPPGFATVSGVWRIGRRGQRRRAIALAIALLSGTLGFVVLNARLPCDGFLPGLGESMLFPMLTGLFGLPTLLLSLSTRRLPPQDDTASEEGRVKPAVKGALIGCFVGWFPGITSTSGSVIANLGSEGRRVDPLESARRFIISVSAVGTSATVFNLTALAVIGRGRSGAMLAVKDLIGREGLAALSTLPSGELSLLLLSVLIASCVGYSATVWLGRSIGVKLARVDTKKVSVGIVVVIVALVLLFTGIAGAVVLSVSLAVGIIPPLAGVSRVHLSGCLLIPIIIAFCGLEPEILRALGG